MIDPVTAISIGSKVLGGIFGSRRRKKARREADAAQQRAAAEQRGYQQDQFGRVQQGESPFREAGLGALTRMARFDNSPLNPQDVYNDPGYQFARDQGMNNIQNTAAARGGLFSGAALKDLTRFNTGNATQFFDNAFRRQQQDRSQRWGQLGDLAGYGERSQGRLNQAGSNFADNMGNIAGAQGNFQAANAIGRGQDSINGMNNLLGAGMDLYGAWGTTKTAPPVEAIGNDVRMPEQFPVRRKDGGRVQKHMVNGRMEPKVGTRSPVLGNTGGGLSREAVLAALDRAAQPEDTGAYGIGALPTNPVADPQGIRRAREKAVGIGYKNGGTVRGPGGTRGDKIPALLSDQEHVIDAKTVKMIGKGSYDKGHNALDKLRKMGKNGA